VRWVHLLVLLLLTATSCATPPASIVDAGEGLTPKERETRLLLEMERIKKQDRSQLIRLMKQAQKGGREFLMRQERESRSRSIELYRTLLSTYPDNTSDYMAEASFRLAELLFEAERERIRMVLETEGDTAEIVPDFNDAIKAYTRVTERFPGHPLTEDALYGIAYCYTEQGDPDQAAYGYARLVENFPGTRYAIEINMRLGEYYFTIEDLDSAIAKYLHVVESGEPEYVEKALYKLGWCYYNLDRYEDAIGSFIAVLDLNKGGKINVGGLAGESMDIIARSYSESGGTPALIRKIRTRPADPFVPHILYKLADLYRERSLFPEAIGTFRTYVELFPSGDSMPEVLTHMRETYHIRGDTLASLELSEIFGKHIGSKTAWYEKASPERRELARTLVLDNLETAANRRRARSQAAGRESELSQAFNNLISYEEITGEDIPCRIKHLKGIVLTEMDRFPDAVHVLNDLAAENRCSQLAEGAILASTDYQIGVYERSAKVDLPLFEKTVDILSGVSSDNPVTPRAILALGEITLNSNDLPEARERLSLLIRRYPDAPESDRARLLIARTFFKEGNYRQAAAWFRESWRNTSDDATIEEAHRLQVYSLFKYAEELSSKDKKAMAAERFEEIHSRFPDSDVAQVSLYNAGKLYRSIGLERKATTLFETLAATYTDSEFASEALQMSVLILEALGDPIRAADDSMILAARSRGEERAAALLKAAQLYNAGNAPGQAASSRSAYTEEFPEPVDELSRQLFLLGRDLEAIGDWDGALAVYTRNVALQRKDPPNHVLTAFAARSQLRIAERSFNRYKSYHIAPPIDEMVVRKREMLQVVIRQFVAAGNYRTADVITASNFFIGRALELFKEDILSSPHPENLTSAEQEEYELLLQEMAFPFETKALDAYRVNIQRSVKLELLDQWIEKTFERMAELAPWSYLRNESIAYPSTLIQPPPPALPPLPEEPEGPNAMEELAVPGRKETL
jgi:tetratricopeptide (TPR) repeat protein